MSHLHFGPLLFMRRTSYPQGANFIGCHQFQFYRASGRAAAGRPAARRCLLNTPHAGPCGGVGPSAARDATAHHRAGPAVWTSIDASRVGAGCRAGAGERIPRRRPASSLSPACCRANRRSATIKGGGPARATPARAKPLSTMSFAAIDHHGWRACLRGLPCRKRRAAGWDRRLPSGAGP